MRKILFFIILQFCLLNLVQAQDAAPAAEHWAAAGRSYEAGQYRNAIDQYEQIVKDSQATAAVYYNLGNAYYKNGQKGKAILNYKRALRLNTADKQARENIAFIQRKTANAPAALQDIFFIRWYQSLLSALPANAWAIAALLCFCTTLIVLYLIRVRSLRFGYRWLSFSAIMTILIISLAITGYRQGRGREEGVVLSGQAFLYEAADPAKVKISIPEGTVVRFLGERKESKILVRLVNGSEGWIEQSDVEII